MSDQCEDRAEPGRVPEEPVVRYLQSLRGVLILILTVAVAVAGIQVVVLPMPAAAASARDACLALHPDSTAPGKKTQCIAEVPLRTRQRLKENCFSSRELQKDAVYQRTDCISGNNLPAEAIAQARAITRFNADGVYGDSAPLGQITPNLQWEVSTISGFPDIVLYDRNVPGSAVRLIEAKLNKYGRGIGEAEDQLVRYVTTFPSGPTNRPVFLYDLSGYTDSFNIEVRKCGLLSTTEVINHYEVSSVPGARGVLLVSDPIVRTRNCTEVPPVPGPNNGGEEEEEEDEIDWDTWLLEHVIVDPVEALQNIPPEVVEDILIGTGVSAALVTATVVCFASGACAALAAAIATGVLAAEGAVAVGTLIALTIASLAGLIGWHIFGDPHIATIDGLSYDLQSVGEFHLLEVPDANIDVQARFSAVNANVSQFSALAFEINGVWVELSGTTLKVNGTPVTLGTNGFYDLGEGAAIMRGGRGNSFYSVVFPGTGTDRLMLMWNGSNVGFHVPPGMRTTGLLGNSNGNPLDDLALGDGTPLPATSSPAVLHGRYADSWRITDDESAFGYSAGQSTATFTNRSFPADVISIGDFSETEIAAATETCQSADVMPGPQFEDCVFDVVSTGDDSYAESAAGVTSVLVDPNDHFFDDAGDLAEDFEGTVGSNFAAPHYMTDPSTTRMAGPLFDTPGYALRARTVGRHQSVRLKADLYAYGNIGDDTVAQSLGLTLDGVAAGQVNFEGADGPTLSGGLSGTIERVAVNTTEAGTPYSKFALDVMLAHSASSVDLQFVPKYFRGVLGTSLGIDNIAMTLTIPVANTFDVALPLTVPSAQATAAQGAGIIEVPGAQDEYRFSLATPTTLVLQTRSCVTGLVATVVNTATGVRTALASTCGNAFSPELPAGNYRLEMYARSTGSYGLDLYAKPAVQSFDLGALTGAATVSDQVPASGAGNLETPLSRDDYAFTLPGTGAIALDFSGSAISPHWVLTRPDGTSRSGNGNLRLDGVVAGNYALRIGDSDAFGNSGNYRLTLTYAAAQTYSLGSLGAPVQVVSDGVPGAGAGRLESKAAEDDYTLTVPVTGDVEFDITCGSGMYYLAWSLLRATDRSVFASNYQCRNQVLLNVPAGDYLLVMTPQYEYVGPYSLMVGMVPAVQSFDLGALTGAVSISDGVPGVGAGRLESRTARDEYRFTLPAAASVFADFAGSAYTPPVRLLRADGSQVSQFTGNYRAQALPAGDYRVVVGDAANPVGTYGAYKLALTGAAAQSFSLGSLGAPVQLVSDGVPGAGAGRLESKAAEDDYSLTVPVTGNVEFDITCGTGMYYLAWSLLRATDRSEFASGYTCRNLTLTNVPAGDYLLVMTPQYEYTGTYSLMVGMVPAVQTFDLGALAGAVSISDGVPAAGAGRLESRTARDEYRFTLPAAASVFADFAGSSYSPPVRLLRADGSQVAQFTGNYRAQGLPAGDYRLVIGDAATPVGTYGPYKLVLTGAAAQSFSLGSLGAPVPLVSDGTPGPGAGRLESKAAEDDYTLTVPVTGNVEFDITCGTGMYYLAWSLLRATDRSTFTSGYTCRNQTLTNVPAGDYLLVVTPQYEYVGSYSLMVGMVPAVQSFDLGALTGAVSISDGVPAAGAGRLESRTARDEYRFTLPGAASVFADFTGSPYFPTTQLLRADGSTVAQFTGNYRAQALPAGDYRLVIGDAATPVGTYGAYKLTLTTNNAQIFALGVLGNPAQLVSDGVPGTGAGRLESKAAEDDYTLTVPVTGDVEFDITCGTGMYYLAWSLLRATDRSLVTSNYQCRNQVLTNVAAGDYLLVITPQYEYTGPYSLMVGMVPAVQSFDLGTLTGAVSISDGVPGPGAGRLESRTARDEYRFTLPGAASVFADFAGSSYTPPVRLLRADGSQVSQFTGNYRAQALPAGDYRLVIGDATNPVGTYGAYKLALTGAAAQAYSLGSLGAPVQLVSDGVPGAGAGRLESKAAEDDYSLTVPVTGNVEFDITCGTGMYYLAWSLLRATDRSLVTSNYQCRNQVLTNVAAGDYLLVITPQYEYVGPYSLMVGMVPAVQSFDLGALTGAVSISDQVPAAGAGRLESRTARDEYRFTLPTAASVFADFAGSAYTPPTQLLRADGSTVAQFTGNYRAQALPAGDYRVVVGDATNPVGTYGAYKLALTGAAAQSFSLGSLGAPVQVVSDGMPGPGAGRLESKAAEDDYTLTVPVTGNVEFDITCGSGMYYLAWWLLRATDRSVFASNYQCRNQVLLNVPAGDYLLVVTPQYEYTGSYSLMVGMVPAVQSFDLGALTGAVSISDQVPAAGAGRLESRTARDEYRFSLPNTASVFADFAGSSYTPPVRLLRADGSQVSQFTGNYRAQALPAGDYRLVIGDAVNPVGTYGAYKLALTGAAAQAYSLGTLGAPVQLVSDGVPGAGAGRLESKAAEDDYTLTVPVTGNVEFDITCGTGMYYLAWSLLRATDRSTLTSGYTCRNQTLTNVPAGDYLLAMTPQYEYTGPYALMVGMVPAVQSFDLGALTGAVSISDGVPGPGAGRLESRTARDEYRFTLPAAASVFADFNTSPYSPPVRLLRADGSQVAQFSGNYRAQALPAGDYRLVIGDAVNPVGTYGAYKLALTGAAAQAYSLGTLGAPAQLVSDGTPGPGAGRLESKAAEDDYTLTVPTTGNVEFDISCGVGLTYLAWSLLRATDRSTLTSGYTCRNQTLTNVPAGDYLLVMTPQWEYTGPYSLTLGRQ